MTIGRDAIRPVGDRAFVVELAENSQVHVLAKAARERLGASLEDVVPGEQTLLLVWKTAPPTASQLADQLATIELTPPAAAATPAVTIAVRYDGPDLSAVAARADLDVDELIELHTKPEYVVAFMGFAPGFAYMTGLDPRLHLPRRAEPRPKVAPGSVAIATTYAAVYPTQAPGGWHLLGHTDADLFDPSRRPPALLEPGTRVTFERT